MVSMMDEDFDMVGKQARVSDEVTNDVDLDLNDLGVAKSEIHKLRVLTGGDGEGRVSFGYHADGGSGKVVGGRLLSTRCRLDERGETAVKTENLEFGLSSGNNSGGEGDSEPKRGVRVEDGSCMDGRDGDLKLERHWNLRASISKKIFGIDRDGSLMKTLSAKVLETEFEMGDMVWGKVKSHPWWPGHLYNEVFASSSVRRTRKNGHILVAFFGDSSYGWFDPDDLVPYDPHYAEKSQQTSSRNFVRAVDESVDEASRRVALGLSCYCRNPNNFRTTDIPGYLAVDIVDFDPGTTYSVSQIQKARDSFRPAETLSFVHQLATAPLVSDNKSLEFVKSKAISLAYRRSKFEEIDLTYAEAFGNRLERLQLPRPSSVEPSRAPLSGPLVFADTSHGRKSSTKAMKPKEQSKKCRYLFKRRDEPNDLIQGHASPSSSAHEDAMSTSTSSGYVFQKRDEAGSINKRGDSSFIDQLATATYAVTSEETLTSGSVLTLVQHLSEADEPGTASVGDVGRVSDNPLSVVYSSDAGYPAAGRTLSKKKVNKRPASELSSGKLGPQEKKVKKIKKSQKEEDIKCAHFSEKHSVNSGRLSPVTPVIEHTQAVYISIDDTQVGPASLTADWEDEADVCQLLADLRGLALNPFHGMGKNGSAIALQFLLKFRSLFFVKSSSASATVEYDYGEARSDRSLGPEATDKPSTDSSKTVSSLKIPKVSSRLDDSTKGGWKRAPSERQEENAAKRTKKVVNLKSLSAEKRTQGLDGKSKAAVTEIPQSRPVKVEQHGKKAEQHARVEEPTYLVMRFQPGSTLPSLVELKARFARFGTLDPSLIRVFYKTNTCRVAFLYKQDAHVAYRYAVGSKSLFANVRFMLKPVTEPQQSMNRNIEDLNGDTDLNPDPSVRPPTLAVLPQPVQPLKSCLKKPLGSDDSGGIGNGGRSSRTARVRFNMEEKSIAISRGVPLSSSSSSSSSSVTMDVNNSQRLLSSLPLQSPLLPLPHLARPSINHQFQQSEMAPRKNICENITTATCATTSVLDVSHVLLPPPPPPPHEADISHQMISLLTRCQDVVTNVKSCLGYVPYHPL